MAGFKSRQPDSGSFSAHHSQCFLSLLYFSLSCSLCLLFLPVSGFDKLSTCAFISSAEAMTRAPGSTACLWSFTRPARGGPSQIRWRCGSYRWTSASLPPLPSGSQSPSRVPGGPLASLELGGGGALQGSAFSQPRPSPPTHHLCFARKHVGNHSSTTTRRAPRAASGNSLCLPGSSPCLVGDQQRVCPGLSAGSAPAGVCRSRARISARFHPWACLSGLDEARDLVFPHMFACFPAPRGCQPEGLMKRSLIAHDSGGWHLSPARWL